MKVGYVTFIRTALAGTFSRISLQQATRISLSRSSNSWATISLFERNFKITVQNWSYTAKRKTPCGGMLTSWTPWRSQNGLFNNLNVLCRSSTSWSSRGFPLECWACGSKVFDPAQYNFSIRNRAVSCSTGNDSWNFLTLQLRILR